MRLIVCLYLSANDKVESCAEPPSVSAGWAVTPPPTHTYHRLQWNGNLLVENFPSTIKYVRHVILQRMATPRSCLFFFFFLQIHIISEENCPLCGFISSLLFLKSNSWLQKNFFFLPTKNFKMPRLFLPFSCLSPHFFTAQKWYRQQSSLKQKNPGCFEV